MRCRSPHRPRHRADLGTLAGFARLPGGHRVRTLAPLLMSEACASNIPTRSRCVWLQTAEGICRLRQGGWSGSSSQSRGLVWSTPEPAGPLKGLAIHCEASPLGPRMHRSIHLRGRRMKSLPSRRKSRLRLLNRNRYFTVTVSRSRGLWRPKKIICGITFTKS